MEYWDLSDAQAQPSAPRILRTDDGAARVIAINLPAGDLLQDHEVHEHAYLHVHSGEVEIDADGATHRAGAGFLAHFDPKERHEVRATSDASLLLFLAPWPGEGRDKDFDA